MAIEKKGSLGQKVRHIMMFSARMSQSDNIFRHIFLRLLACKSSSIAYTNYMYSDFK